MSRRPSYNEATAALTPAYIAWADARAAVQAAKDAYLAKVKEIDAKMCWHCYKPMPDYDDSTQCDECHLPWGSSTPEGRKKLEAARIDAQIKALQERKAKL